MGASRSSGSGGEVAVAGHGLALEADGEDLDALGVPSGDEEDVGAFRAHPGIGAAS